MSNVDDIVQNFVSNDLSSLDRIGGQSDFSLSPHLTQASPDPNAEAGGAENTAKTGPKLASGTNSQPAAAAADESSTAKTAPETGKDAGGAGASATGTAKDTDTGKESSTSPAVNTPRTTSSSAFATPKSTASADTRPERPRQASTTSSVSTAEREKTPSFGDRFKKFGKRIASGSKK